MAEHFETDSDQQGGFVSWGCRAAAAQLMLLLQNTAVCKRLPESSVA